MFGIAIIPKHLLSQHSYQILQFAIKWKTKKAVAFIAILLRLATLSMYYVCDYIRLKNEKWIHFHLGGSSSSGRQHMQAWTELKSVIFFSTLLSSVGVKDRECILMLCLLTGALVCLSQLEAALCTCLRIIMKTVSSEK